MSSWIVEALVGATHRRLLVDGLTRTQIVQYAGASGDFNPLHTDERYAEEAAGNPSIFAHGMLTMGMTGAMLSEWLGAGRLVRFGARFLAKVWPGDTLTAEATVDKVHEHLGDKLVELSIVVTNQGGTAVLSGSAVVVLEGPPRP